MDRWESAIMETITARKDLNTITASEAEDRASKGAEQMISDLMKLNANVREGEGVDVKSFWPMFQTVFMRALASSYVITPDP
jgi:hypothetical protein